MGKHRLHLDVTQMPAGSKCLCFSAYSDALYMFDDWYLMWCRIGNSIIQTSVKKKKERKKKELWRYPWCWNGRRSVSH